MLEQYIVEGVNFLAIVGVDLELASDPYMEAATKTMENIFRHGPDVGEEFKLLIEKNTYIQLSDRMIVYKNGDLGMDGKERIFPTVLVAKNAGILEVARQFEIKI